MMRITFTMALLTFGAATINWLATDQRPGPLLSIAMLMICSAVPMQWIRLRRAVRKGLAGHTRDVDLLATYVLMASAVVLFQVHPFCH